jgi:hypothetical protein
MAKSPDPLDAKVQHYLNKANEARAVSERIRAESETKRRQRQAALKVVVKEPTPTPRPARKKS